MSSAPNGIDLLAAEIATLQTGSNSSAVNSSNNPGLLELGNVGKGTTGSYTNYDNPITGISSLENILSGVVSSPAGQSPISSLGSVYPTSNSDIGNQLAQQLGVDPNTSISSVAEDLATQQAYANNASSSTNSDYWSKIQAIGNANQVLMPSKDGGQVQQESKGLVNWTRYSLMGLGILLIGAGVFSFKQTQVVIQQAGKIAAIAA